MEPVASVPLRTGRSCRRRPVRSLLAGALVVLLAFTALGSSAGTADARPRRERTVRVNLPDPSTGNREANHHTDDVFEATMSADGRYVVFTSQASNLVAADTDNTSDLFLRDRRRGTTELVNVSSAGVKGIGDAPFALDVTPDGRYVVFASDAPNLVADDLNGQYDVFVRDRVAGTTELISVTDPSLPGGPGGNGASGFDYGGAAISDDGRIVVFQSAADNLVPNDTNGALDIFVRDRPAGATTRVNLTPTGAQADGNSFRPRLSGDGRYIVFSSLAGNLDPADDTPGQPDVYLHDRALGTTELVSVAPDGTAGDGSSGWGWPADDGAYVVFQSAASDLDPADDNQAVDIYVRRRGGAPVTELLVTEPDGTAPDLGASFPYVSPDFRWVLFGSPSDDLVAGDTNGVGDVFVLDTTTQAITRVSVGRNGTEANHWSTPVALSDDGRQLAFMSYASNLVRGDNNNADDVFVRQRRAGRTAG